MILIPILVDRDWALPDFTIDLPQKPSVGEMIMLSKENVQKSKYTQEVCYVQNIMYSDEGGAVFVLLTEDKDLTATIEKENLENIASTLSDIQFVLEQTILSQMQQGHSDVEHLLDSISSNIRDLKGDY